MSLQPAQTRPLERVASRRTVIRTAAWTAPAVSIAVAAPAFAASGATETPSGVVTAPNGPYKGTVSGSLKHVSWDGLALRNTSATASIVTFQIVFTGYAENAATLPKTMTVTSTTTPGGTWSADPKTLTATWTGELAAGQSLQFDVRFTGDNNSSGSLTMVATSGGSSYGTVTGKF